MSNASKIRSVENSTVTLANSIKFKVSDFDAFTIKGWSHSDEVEYTSSSLYNINRKQKVNATRE